MLGRRDFMEKFRNAPDPVVAGSPFRLISSVQPPAAPGEVELAWRSRDLPVEVVHLWQTTRGARLFEDADFGQWGLVLLDPRASRERTDREFLSRRGELRRGDVVVGEFLGDSDLLVVAPSETGDRRLMIALPLDPRSEWYGVGADLADFLDAFYDAGGDKYWEGHRRRVDLP